MTLNKRQHGLAASHDLQKLAPGLYIDDTGSEYFYLTGLYPTIAHRLLKNPLLDTPAFVSNVLRELRCALQERCSMELMD